MPLTEAEKTILRQISKDDRSFEGPLTPWEASVWRKNIDEYNRWRASQVGEGIIQRAEELRAEEIRTLQPPADWEYRPRSNPVGILFIVGAITLGVLYLRR